MATINSKIGTSTTNWAFGNPYQRFAFYALSRFWVFYSDGTNGVWRTSTDGSTWSAATTVRAITVGYKLCVALDGTSIHYSFSTGRYIYYRMGTIAADGTISWLAAEQTVVDVGVGHTVEDAAITVDSNGFPWITVADHTTATVVSVPKVWKSSTKNGTWTNETVLFTSPYQFSDSVFDAASGISCWTAVVPLSGGQIYVMAQPSWTLIGGSEARIRGRLWNGSTWGDEGTVASPVDAILNGHFSPVVDSHDNIFLTYTDYDSAGAGARTGYFTIRNASTGLWGTPAIMRTPTTEGVGGVTCIDTNDIVYHFYPTDPTAKHIYYKRYVNDAWETVTDWITETQAFGDEYGSYQVAAVVGALGRIIYTYVTLTASPWDVKMAALEFLNERSWGQK